MILEGANKFSEANDYIIYTMNSMTTGQYCAVLPKNISETLNMLIDFRGKKSFDAVSMGGKTKEELVEEISKEYLNLKKKYVSGILVLPMIDEAGLDNAIMVGDKQKMFDETKHIGAITSELYKKLTDIGIEKQKIDQKIIIVEKNEKDEKFVAWLKEQMPNFVDGMLYSEVEEKSVFENPFMPNESSVMSEQSVSSGGIFDQIPSPVMNANPIPPAQPTANSVVEPVTTPVVEPVSMPSENTSFDLFGSVPATPAQPAVVESVKPEVVSSPVTPDVEAPKPVQNVDLEGTITFNPIPEPQLQTQPQQQPVNVETPNVASQTISVNNNENVGVSEERKSSKGFANLLILLVVLIGVTIASIELGKFLYSVYGA